MQRKRGERMDPMTGEDRESRRKIRPGGHIELFFALLLFALQPVFIQGQSPTPTPASVDASLFQAQSVRCEWGQGTIVSWDEGRPVLEQGNFGKDAGIVFDSIDTQAGTARIIGNAAAGDIRVVVTPVGLTFIEKNGSRRAELHDSVCTLCWTGERRTSRRNIQTHRPLWQSISIAVPRYVCDSAIATTDKSPRTWFRSVKPSAVWAGR